MTQPPMEPPPPPSGPPPSQPPPPPSAPDYGSAPYQPPPPSGSSTGSTIARMALRIGIPVAAFIVIGVVSAIIANRDDADRDDDGNVTEQGDLDVFAVAKGDCLDDETLSAIGTTQSSEISEVTAIPCSEPHGYEAFHLFDLEGDAFPGIPEVERLAQEGCVEAFGTFIGLPYDQSVLEFVYLYPQASAWTAADDREVVCLVAEPGGKLTKGSLEGAKR